MYFRSMEKLGQGSGRGTKERTFGKKKDKSGFVQTPRRLHTEYSKRKQLSERATDVTCSERSAAAEYPAKKYREL